MSQRARFNSGWVHLFGVQFFQRAVCGKDFTSIPVRNFMSARSVWQSQTGSPNKFSTYSQQSPLDPAAMTERTLQIAHMFGEEARFAMRWQPSERIA